MSNKNPFFAGADVEHYEFNVPGSPDLWWVDLKCELTDAEESRYKRAAVPFVQRGEQDRPEDMRMSLDMPAMARERALVYIADWNVPAANGKGVADIDRETISRMKPAVFKIIDGVIDQHVEKMTKNGVKDQKPSGGGN